MGIVSELISIVGTILGAVGVMLTINSNKKEKRLRTVTWSDLQSATKYFWRKLKHNKFVPTFIITPGQKGGIIAQLVRDFYEENIPIFSGFLEPNSTSRAFDDNYFTIITTKWRVHMPISIKTFEDKESAKILIVDDFVMSGDFLLNLKNTLLELGYQKDNICACSVAVTKVAIDGHKEPDYYWKVVENKDFYFPWGKAE